MEDEMGGWENVMETVVQRSDARMKTMNNRAKGRPKKSFRKCFRQRNCMGRET
jgi:hypothetical protein